MKTTVRVYRDGDAVYHVYYNLPHGKKVIMDKCEAKYHRDAADLFWSSQAKLKRIYENGSQEMVENTDEEA